MKHLYESALSGLTESSFCFVLHLFRQLYAFVSYSHSHALSLRHSTQHCFYICGTPKTTHEIHHFFATLIITVTHTIDNIYSSTCYERGAPIIYHSAFILCISWSSISSTQFHNLPEDENINKEHNTQPNVQTLAKKKVCQHIRANSFKSKQNNYAKYRCSGRIKYRSRAHDQAIPTGGSIMDQWIQQRQQLISIQLGS